MVRHSICAACIGALALVPAPAVLAGEPISSPATTPWARWTASPAPVDVATLSPHEREALSRCGEGDVGLGEVAQALVARRLDGLPIADVEAIAQAQRAAGEPHPWARSWVASGRPLDLEATLHELDAWLAAGERRNRRWRRCGVASGGAADGTTALALVTVEALADLAPLPTQAHAGQWLTVEARMRVRAQGGQILVLGPSGLPRTLLTSFDGTTLRARFAPERPGPFAVQVVADLAEGPRPVLDARVFADMEPASPAASVRSDPEPATATGLDDAASLARWLGAMRASAGLRPLQRDRRLDAVAQAHAARMEATRELAHDAGDGSPTDRLRSIGLDASVTGENVAHASTVALAHRAFWDSPSHRANMLSSRFDRFGVGVIEDEHGDAWAVELFTSDL